MTNICKFCSESFRSPYVLKKHQITAKYCLKIQGKIEDIIIKKEEKNFKCEACLKSLTTKNGYSDHLRICKEIKKQKENKIENELEELKIKLEEQKERELKMKLEYQIKNEIYENDREKESKNNILKEIFIKTDIIQNFKLTLEDKSIINIPVRNDGYVNVTELCKASNKNIDNWKKTKESKTLLQFFKVTPENQGIASFQMVKDEKNSKIKQSIFAHPDIAIQIAQWCSPKFTIQVSRWIRELLVGGKVQFGNEKTYKEIEYISDQKRLSLDIQPYLFKDVLYFFEFKPDTEYLSDKSTLEDENIHYFEFGVTSNIQQRQSNYGSGHRLDKVFSYDTGFKASLAESHVKKLLLDMNLKLNYKNKIECMRCTYEELENLYTQMLDHNFTSKEEPQNIENIYTSTNISDYNFELQKLQIEAETEKEKERIKAETEKVTNKRQILMTMLKEGLLTFEQFKLCFEFC